MASETSPAILSVALAPVVVNPESLVAVSVYVMLCPGCTTVPDAGFDDLANVHTFATALLVTTHDIGTFDLPVNERLLPLIVVVTGSPSTVH